MLCVCVCLSTKHIHQTMFVQFSTCCFCIVSIFAYFCFFLSLFFPTNKVSLGATKCPALHYEINAQLARICGCNICILAGDGC